MAEITVGIPTYNRRESVERVCRSLLPAVRDGIVSVLVVDDGSTDGTTDHLRPLECDGLRLVSHDVNQGYARALLTILDFAESDYVAIVNDDDVILLDGFPGLAPWLDAVTPDLVCTQYRNVVPAKVPGVTPTGALDFRDYRSASSHAPGMVLRVSSLPPAVGFLRSQVDRDNVAALVYPQAVVAAWLCVTGSAWWCGESIVEEDSDLPSGIRDMEGLHYWSAKSRVSQALGFHDMLVDLVGVLPEGQPRERARTLLALQARTIYPALRNAVVETGGAPAGAALDAATSRQLLAATLRRIGLRR